MRQEILDALEVLDLPLKAILQRHKVKIEIIEKMEDAFPDDLEKIHYMGAYDWGRNTIFLPEKVLQNGKLIDNFDIDFVIRHETGHAFNSKILEKPDRYYFRPKRLSDRSEAFVNAFNKDLANGRQRNQQIRILFR